MMEPRRLLEDDDHPAARALLVAALDERAPRGAARRAMLALGVGTAATAASGASAAASVKQALSLAAIAKWFGAGAVLGLVTAGGALAGSDAARTQTTPARAIAAASTPAQSPGEPAANSSAETESEPRSDSEDSRRASRAHAPTLAKSARPDNGETVAQTGPSSARFELGEDPLASEVRLLDQARRAIASGSSATALGVLERYDSQHASGRLAPEAFVLRLEALVGAGRRAEARQLAERRLARDPNGAHAERIRKIIGAP